MSRQTDLPHKCPTTSANLQAWMFGCISSLLWLYLSLYFVCVVTLIGTKFDPYIEN